MDHSARVTRKSKANFVIYCELQNALIINLSNAHCGYWLYSSPVCLRVGCLIYRHVYEWRIVKYYLFMTECVHHFVCTFHTYGNALLRWVSCNRLGKLCYVMCELVEKCASIHVWRERVMAHMVVHVCMYTSLSLSLSLPSDVGCCFVCCSHVYTGILC